MTNCILAAEVSAPGRGTKRRKSASKARGWWRQPWQIDSLLLDTEALLTALQTGISACLCFTLSGLVQLSLSVLSDLSDLTVPFFVSQEFWVMLSKYNR